MTFKDARAVTVGSVGPRQDDPVELAKQALRQARELLKAQDSGQAKGGLLDAFKKLDDSQSVKVTVAQRLGDVCRWEGNQNLAKGGKSMKDFEDAQRWYKASIDLDMKSGGSASSIGSWTGRGVCEYMLGENENAVGSFLKAAELAGVHMEKYAPKTGVGDKAADTAFKKVVYQRRGALNNAAVSSLAGGEFNSALEFYSQARKPVDSKMGVIECENSIIWGTGSHLAAGAGAAQHLKEKAGVTGKSEETGIMKFWTLNADSVRLQPERVFNHHFDEATTNIGIARAAQRAYEKGGAGLGSDVLRAAGALVNFNPATGDDLRGSPEAQYSCSVHSVESRAHDAALKALSGYAASQGGQKALDKAMVIQQALGIEVREQDESAGADAKVNAVVSALKHRADESWDAMKSGLQPGKGAPPREAVRPNASAERSIRVLTLSGGDMTVEYSDNTRDIIDDNPAGAQAKLKELWPKLKPHLARTDGRVVDTDEDVVRNLKDGTRIAIDGREHVALLRKMMTAE